MDANGLRFWMLSDAHHWRVEPGSHADYDSDRRTVKLASERTVALPPEADEATALARVELVPQTIDAFGTRASWDNASKRIVATGALEGSVGIFTPAAGTSPSDLAMGYDGILYIAVAPAGEVVMQDRRGRWKPVTLRLADFVAWRLAADPAGGVWVLDRTDKKLARIDGQPLPLRPYGPYSVNTFRPCDENSDPPQLRVVANPVCPDDETPIAIACSEQGRLALLTWVRAGLAHEGGFARVRCWHERSEEGGSSGFAAPIDLRGASYAYSIVWVSDSRVAVLLENVASESPVYQIDDETVSEEGRELLPVGDIYPLKDRTNEGGPFVHGVTLPPRYPTSKATAPLFRLSLPSFARLGVARNATALDSGSAQTAWHRLYLEAHIPPECGVRVYLTASDEAVAPPEDETDEWHPHLFGGLFARPDPKVPRAVWVSKSSEIPFDTGLLRCEPEKGTAGLFTVLIQRSNRRVRTLRGRYLHVRVELLGDGRSTPEVAALRAYGSRFSYIDRYLPEFYREQLFGPDADSVVSGDQRTTPHDFLERFVDNFEGVLTPLEDRIASSYLLTDPRTIPEDAIEWLGSWIGMSLHPGCPPKTQREMLRNAPALYRGRGTVDGLRLALEIATGGVVPETVPVELRSRPAIAMQFAEGGGVSGGEIVVIEDFRLRRTFATILGADLSNEDDPLLGGFAQSGNSFVGDTLFLGDEHKKEFLALFNADLPVKPEEAEAIFQLFDRLANRVTVLVHQEVEPQDMK
ncbi:MAG TPA: phage tail protein, partial [Blastocatellia bacterium]|nr:phage tail protein [Blastocatellia bacterium]